MSAGTGSWMPGRRPGLYRDVANGRIAGVCAGIGNYLQIRHKFVRGAVVLLGIFVLPSLVPLVLSYIFLAVFLPTAPAGLVQQPAPPPSASAPDPFGSLHTRFRALDLRLASIEQQVTSNEFALREKFRNL